MPQKKRFLLRVDEEVYSALQRWAADEWRSVNAQIEYVLRDALRRAGRLGSPGHRASPGPHPDDDAPPSRQPGETELP